MAKETGKPRAGFDLARYLKTSGTGRKMAHYEANHPIFFQGDKCSTVLYIQSGSVKIKVTSPSGREAVVAILGPGDFFGEGCIAGQEIRVATAVAMEAVVALVIEKQEMMRMIHQKPAFADKFVGHMLRRNVRIEEDLVDQLFNSSEKRLARALLLMARYGTEPSPSKVIAKVSQETLAEMIGTTRSRVSFFMNRFRKLGFIRYNGGLHVNDSLLRVLLRDD